MSISGRTSDGSTEKTSATAAGDSGVVQLDGSVWSAFLNAKNETAFQIGWLAVMVSKIDTARMGVLLQADPAAQAFVPVAVVPDPRRDLSHLKDVSEAAVTSGKPVARPTDGGHTLVAYPIALSPGIVRGVAILELAGQSKDTQKEALRELHWAAGWLASKGWEETAGTETSKLRRSGIAIDILALTGEHPKPAACAMAVVNEIHAKLGHDHVAIGMIVKRHTSPRIKLMAMSHAAWFKKRSSAAELLETAMEEAFDQNVPTASPPLPSTARAISVAHEDLIKGGGRISQVLSVPLADEHGPVGVLTVERRQAEPAFTDEQRFELEAVAGLLGPVLETKRRNHRWVAGRIVDTVIHALGVVLGPRRLSWKLLALAIAAFITAATLATGTFRVQADAVLRGDVQRAVTVPFAGFVAEAPFRAGERVEAGQEIARLDDADLRLELLRTRSEIDRLTVQSRNALANYERAQVAALEAQIEQARAQANLSQTQLDRTIIRAPVSGLIVQGDLSQRLGAPVQAGEVLFEIVPDDTYRAEVYVDERDLRYVTVGQEATLALSGRPSDPIPMTVTRVTPVAEPREGYNAFRVEADLTGAVPGDIRPGMEGRAKVIIDERKYAWIWTRRLVDWLRHTYWTWQP